MKKRYYVIIGVVAALLIGTAIFFGATPVGRKLVTGYEADMEKAGEDTYTNKKKVEDTCRAYYASYKADKAGYEQYKDDADEYYSRLAQQYKQRANQTATTYNEYFLKNEYVWKGNVPSDLPRHLDLLV